MSGSDDIRNDAPTGLAHAQDKAAQLYVPGHITLFHASLEEIREPRWNYTKEGAIKINKDFGEGFYTSPDKEYPLRLYCMNDSVIMNKYALDTSGLRVLRLDNDIKWLLVTAFHRRDYSGFMKYHSFRDQIRDWVSEYDLVVGTISNDNFYSTVNAFIRNLLTDSITLQIVQIMNYGEQYVLKSDKACRQIKYIGSESVDLQEIEKHRAAKTTERNTMEEMVEDMRVRLHATDNGKLFAQVIEEMGHDISTWS